MSEPVWIATSEAFSVGIIEGGDDIFGFSVVVRVEGAERSLSNAELSAMKAALFEGQMLTWSLGEHRDGRLSQRNVSVYLKLPPKDAPLATLIEWERKNSGFRRKGTPMTIEELDLAAKSLFGPKWLEPLARAVKLPKRELERIIRGKEPMPDWMREAVAQLAGQRIEAANAEAEKLVKWT